MQISEAVREAAEDYIAEHRVYKIDDQGNQIELIVNPQVEDLEPFFKRAIDAETAGLRKELEENKHWRNVADRVIGEYGELESENTRLKIMAGEGKDALDRERKALIGASKEIHRLDTERAELRKELMATRHSYDWTVAERDRERERCRALVEAMKEFAYRTKLLIDDMDAKGKPEWRASATFGFFGAMNAVNAALKAAGEEAKQNATEHARCHAAGLRYGRDRGDIMA